MPSPFSCSPVIRKWLWKKTQIEKKIDTIPVLGENIDAWKTPGMGMKDFSNFANDNWNFRKNVKTKKKDNEVDQFKTITRSYANAVNN